MACDSCDGFRRQGHGFCSACGASLGTPGPAAHGSAEADRVPDPVVDDDLWAWGEQGWTIRPDRPCAACGNPQTCSRVEVAEQVRGYDPGTAVGCNPLVVLGVWLLDSLIKRFSPPRIATLNADRVVCPRCRSEYYENGRVVAERPLR